MSFNFSDSDLKEKEFKPVAPGEYEAEIYKVKIKDKQIMVSFNSTETGDYLCNDFLHFTEKGRPSAIQKLVALGLEKNDDGKYVVDDEGKNLIGLSAVLTLVPADNPKYLKPDFNAKNYGYQAIEIAF